MQVIRKLVQKIADNTNKKVGKICAANPLER